MTRVAALSLLSSACTQLAGISGDYTVAESGASGMAVAERAGQAGSVGGSSSGDGGWQGGGASGDALGGGGAQGLSGNAGTSAGGAGPQGEGPCPPNVLGHCDAGASAASYPVYPGYTLALVEDFPAPFDLDQDPIFTWSDGSPAGSQTGFRKEQIGFANGKLLLTATSDCPPATVNSACYPQRTSYADPALNMTTGPVGKMGVWSGELRSKYDNYRYGRYEAKLRGPSANPGHQGDPSLAGGFLSKMFVFRSPKWLTWTEITLQLKGNIPTKVSGNVVSAKDQFDFPATQAAIWTSSTGLAESYLNSNEHVYSFTWTPTEIKWFVDGVQVQSFAAGGTPNIPVTSGKIMLSLWMFAGNLYGDNALNHYPLRAEYDYFRFYKWNAEATYPCSPTPACLPAADKLPSARNNPNESNYGL